MRLAQGKRLLTACLAGSLAAGLLAGCGAQETGLQRDAARQLQARVLEVTQASSQNNPVAALQALEGLEAELEAAQGRGDISEERRRSITTIATAVRADLKDVIAAAEAAAAQAAEAAAAKAAEEKAAEAKAAEEKAAAEAALSPSPLPEPPAPVIPQPAPVPVPEQDKEEDKKDEEKDKGKGKD
ncbi:hypothetical protein FDW83_14125 [Pseudarthrobacter sp. NamE2]|nr:hypothetical protein [Pseudarthrobacter sp. NamE2]TLM81993.1 hypothetical protein FDW83_14125 [Pseudarthrobacter sp. NamE2]